MASTYSSNLKIELMGTGENSGTWGNITNTNLGTAFEQAVIGLGNPDYTSDANLTITLTDSNASQAARCLVLNVTSAFGSLTATRELIVPTIQKQYIVQNNTTGGQSITVKTSAGTGITVPNGRKAHLYVDGTNVIQMFDFVDINGGAIDGTTIGASSASTGAFTTLNASGATTLDGTVALGNAAGDIITVPGTIGSNLIFTDNTYDIGASGATRPRNLFLAGAATVGGNLSVGGTLTLTGGVNLNGNVTVGDTSADTLTINSTITSNLIFTDNTYDIGASGATRPRNLFLAGNATIGGAQTLTGALTVDSTTDTSSTTTGSIQTDGGVGIAKGLYVGGNTTLGDASTDTVTVNGYMAVGGAPAASTAMTVASTALTSTQQFGVSGQITGSSAATSLVAGVDAYPQTANASFTTTNVAGFYARAGLKGASNTASNWHGVYIADQTQGTNNYGVTSLVSSGTNKWNIYASGTAQNYFGGYVGIGTTVPVGLLDASGSVYSRFLNTTAPTLDNDTHAGEALYLRSGGTAGAENVQAVLAFGKADSSSQRSGAAIASIQTTSDTDQIGLAFYVSASTSSLQTMSERFRIGTTEAVFNEVSADYDFRVESDTNSHMLFVDASQDAVLINTNTSVGVGSGAVGKQQIATTSATIHLSLANYNAVDTDGGILAFGKSRGATVGSYTAVQNGDTLGEIRFAGADGTDLQTNGATIRAQVDGTPGGNDMPGRLVFLTTADGSATPAEVARITSDKYLRMASGTGGIQFNGDTAAANALDDYEEGSWTPVIEGSTGAGSYTYTNGYGYYTKIGQQVTVTFNLTNITEVSAGTGYMQIKGLPFAKSSGVTYNGSLRLSSATLSAGTTWCTLEFISGSASSILYVLQMGSGSAGVDFPVSSINSGTTDVTGTITYIV